MATSRYLYTPPPPPWSCPMCLVGACHRCTGRVVVGRIAGPSREEPCGHVHPARGPVARVLAAAYRRPAKSSAAVEIDAQTLRTMRQERGLTQVKLAALSGLSNSTVSALETGISSRVSPPTYIALCDALGIPASERRTLRKAHLDPEVTR